MKKPEIRPLVVLLLLAALLGPAGRAPAADAGGGSLPFVTRLNAVVAQGRVSLAWKDVEGSGEGKAVVYRHTEPITESSFPAAVLLSRVAMGRETYADDPPDDGGYYYAVLVEDKEGKIYPVFIPFRNCTGAAASVRTPTPVSGEAASVASAGPQAADAGSDAASGAAAVEAGPMVSALAATAVDYRIRLSWKDPVGIREGAAVVYRSLQAIDSVPPRDAEPLDRVPPGKESYEDIPPDEQRYFYAVLWERQGRRTNPGVYAGRNRTGEAVAVQFLASEAQLASRITGIHAELSADGESITVGFRSANPRRELLLFWSTFPIVTEEDLLRSATPIPLDPRTVKHQVYTIPGADSWFAVLDAGLFKVGRTDLSPGENATTAPVAVALRLAEGQTMRRRNLPLPELRLNAAIGTGPEIGLPPALQAPPLAPVSAATAKALAAILSAVAEPAASEMRPVVLPVDRTPASSGDLQPLPAIALGPLMQGRMADAQRQILDFLKVQRSPDAQARARYYLGQAYYFQGKIREAFLEFLSAQDLYYAAVRPWMDACYRQLARAGAGPS